MRKTSERRKKAVSDYDNQEQTEEQKEAFRTMMKQSWINKRTKERSERSSS